MAVRINIENPVNRDKVDKDIELWEQWNKTKSPNDLQNLVNRMDPIIRTAVMRLSGGTIGTDVLLAKGKVLAVQAIKSYDPKKGVALATHITNGIAPLHRVVYTHQNTARLPENITLKINQYNAAKEHMLSNLGREPTVEELHQELGWSANEIKKLDTYQRKDLVESLNNTGDAFGKEEFDDDLLASIYYDLNPQEKKLFEYSTGYGSYKRSNPEIMKLMGLTQPQLSYQKLLLTKKIQELIKKSGYTNRSLNIYSKRDLG